MFGQGGGVGHLSDGRLHMRQAGPGPLSPHLNTDAGLRRPPLTQPPQAWGRLGRLSLPGFTAPLLLLLLLHVGSGGAGGRAGVSSRLFCRCCAGQDSGGVWGGVGGVKEGDWRGCLRPAQCCTCKILNFMQL